MSYALQVIKDNPIMFLPLDETVGPTAYDISGCGNNGTHSDGILSGILPLIPGGVTGTRITNTKYVDCSLVNNYYGQEQVVSFANAGFSDNDFSMEVLIYPNFNSSENLVFGDQVNDIGISWHNGNIIFKLQSEVIEYTVPYYKKSLHIVASYTVNAMSLYLDGTLVAYKILNGFKFTNEYLNISIGPTAASNSSFVVDAPAIYRYSLAENQIKEHYRMIQYQVPAIQVATPEDGILYSISDENSKEIYSVTYPYQRSLKNLSVDGLSYDDLTQSLYMTITDTAEESTVVITDKVPISSQSSIIRSKIRWLGDNGISVETSLDNDTYSQCINGDPIPGLTSGVASGYGELYVRITFYSSDTSKYNPELSFLSLSFYSEDVIGAENSGELLYKATGSELTIGDTVYPVLSRDYRNGLRVKADNSFYAEADAMYRTIELFYTPSSLSASSLINVEDDAAGYIEYSWLNDGTVMSMGPESIYVNGADKTSQTNISNVFKAGEIHHVVITFQELNIPVTIRFNAGYTLTPSSTTEALYNNIAFYDRVLTQSEIEAHYDSYVSRPSASNLGDTITLSESAISVRNNDWVVIKSI